MDSSPRFLWLQDAAKCTGGAGPQKKSSLKKAPCRTDMYAEICIRYSGRLKKTFLGGGFPGKVLPPTEKHQKSGIGKP